MNSTVCLESKHSSRRYFIGGSDARIIMGDDQAALVRLWKEKRGEVEPQVLSGDLLVQLGTVTEHLNRRWYEKSAGNVLTEVQQRVFHSVHRWMAATLDGRIEAIGAVFEAKFTLPWNFSEEAAAEKHMAQLQHNMWVTASRTAALSRSALPRLRPHSIRSPSHQICRAARDGAQGQRPLHRPHLLRPEAR